MVNEDNSLENKFFTPQKDEATAEKKVTMNSSTPITPIKIEKFG